MTERLLDKAEKIFFTALKVVYSLENCSTPLAPLTILEEEYHPQSSTVVEGGAPLWGCLTIRQKLGSLITETKTVFTENSQPFCQLAKQPYSYVFSATVASLLNPLRS